MQLMNTPGGDDTSHHISLHRWQEPYQAPAGFPTQLIDTTWPHAHDCSKVWHQAWMAPCPYSMFTSLQAASWCTAAPAWDAQAPSSLSTSSGSTTIIQRCVIQGPRVGWQSEEKSCLFLALFTDGWMPCCGLLLPTPLVQVSSLAILPTVLALRQQRCLMVQKAPQYVYIARCIR